MKIVTFKSSTLCYNVYLYLFDKGVQVKLLDDFSRDVDEYHWVDITELVEDISSILGWIKL